MTPFGIKIREYRLEKGIFLKDMAEGLGVTSAYISALEHGYRGRPGPGLVQQICGYLDLIWDDAEELKRLSQLSNPKVVVNTSGLSPQATLLANLLSERIREIDVQTLDWIVDEIGGRPSLVKGPTY